MREESLTTKQNSTRAYRARSITKPRILLPTEELWLRLRNWLLCIQNHGSTAMVQASGVVHNQVRSGETTDFQQFTLDVNFYFFTICTIMTINPLYDRLKTRTVKNSKIQILYARKSLTKIYKSTKIQKSTKNATITNFIEDA